MATKVADMNQYPEHPGFVRGSDTSEAAAESVAGPAAAIRATIRQHIHNAEAHEHPGYTCDELEAITGGRHQTVSARVRELVLSGDIHDTGDRRPTRSGRNARIYRIRPADLPTDGQGSLFGD
jgi:hypothetical protein